MWRQKNIGCILFGRTYFPCRFSDDLNDFVLHRDTLILGGDAHPFHASTDHVKVMEDLKYERSLPPWRS